MSVLSSLVCMKGNWKGDGMDGWRERATYLDTGSVHSLTDAADEEGGFYDVAREGKS